MAQENPSCPGRMDTSNAQETSTIYVTLRKYAQRTTAAKGRHANTSDGLRNTRAPSHQVMACVARAGNARPPRRPAKSSGEGLTGCRSNIGGTAGCFFEQVDACALLAVLFCWRREQSAKKCKRALPSGACNRPTYNGQHATRTHCTTRPGGVESQPSHDFRSAQITHTPPPPPPPPRPPPVTPPQQQHPRSPIVVCRFFQSASRIDSRNRWLFARKIQIPKRHFPIQNQNVRFGFSHAVSNPILF